MSNPCMQIRHRLKDEGRESEPLYKYMETTFALIFIFNRSTFGHLFSYNCYFYNLSFTLQVVISIIVALSTIWIFAMLSMLAKRLKEKNDKPTGLTKICIEVCMFLKKHQKPISVIVFVLTIGMPTVMKWMGFKPVHLRINNFTIV